VYQIQDDRKGYNYTVQMYDRDLFKSNDLIGEAQINLKQMIDDCSLTKNCIQLNKKYYNDTLKKTQAFKNKNLQFTDDDESRFWVEMNKKDKNNRLSKTGIVKMQIDVVPLEMA